MSFLSGLLILGCLFETQGPPDLAGTSISTGNPSSILLDFKEDGVPVQFTGKVEIFGATQVPLPDLQPFALGTFPVTNADTFTLRADQLGSIPDSAWPSTSRIGDSLIRFNAVVSDGKRISIVRGFRYHPGKVRIDWVDSTEDAPASMAALRREVSLTHLTRFTARSGLSIKPGDDHYLFIIGTGFIAVGDSTASLFQFEAIPSGSHRFQWISVWKPGLGPSSKFDSIYAVNALAPIRTDGDGEFDLDSVSFSIPVPRNFRDRLASP